MLRRLAGLTAFLVPTLALAQTPAGGEFRVNVSTTSSQFIPQVAVGAEGDFVVAFNSMLPGGDYEVRARRYDAAGAPRGVELLVAADAVLPDVAMGRKGAFVVVWRQTDGLDQGVFARRYDRNGVAQGPAFVVNTYTTGYQGDASIGGDAAGRFVVAWTSAGQDGSGNGVFARRFDAAGSPSGAAFQVNLTTSGDQDEPDVALAPDGAFVVAWESRLQDGSGDGSYGRRFNAGGQPLGGEFRINTQTVGDQDDVAVGIAADGSFVVAFESLAGPGPEEVEIRGQRFDASGALRGAEFAVNTYTTGYQFFYGLAIDRVGNFVVTWDDYEVDGSDWGVFGRRFAAAGSPRGAPFRVNSFTSGYQSQSRLAADDAGNLVVTWHSFDQDGDGFGVFAQRFGGLRPAALAVDTNGNEVLEPGESVTLRPSWRNVNGAPQTFAAGLSSLTGPPGATYTITDATGDYGTVADGATAPCTDCFGASVSNPPVRPATHWDASVVESITPDAQGQQKIWRLHVGASFTDVEGASPFYRFVETLLHHAVTGGCSATTYCPTTSATREQMAVFVLVASEGSSYLPPACATPVFGDVPASSPFCRWIEELSRRGVVSGCGGGNYCPDTAVTREQMAVFVLRTLDPSLDPPACTTPVFGDVPASSPFCRWVEELVRRGVVTGCGGGNYCPAAAVTREQMAVFIASTFGLTLYGP